MNRSVRLTDDQIGEMLVELAGAPMPTDLTTAVVMAVRDARAGERDKREGQRSRPTLLLLAAAIVVSGSIVVASFAGSRQPSVARPTAPPERPAPSQQAVAPTSPATCPDFDQAARNGGVGTGVGPVPGAAPARHENGALILLSPEEKTRPVVLDPLGPAPSPTPAGSWSLDSFAVNSWAASSDGTVVAAELDEPGCLNDVFVMHTDGTSLRRPFADARQDVFSPAWSPDGAYLAAVTAPPLSGDGAGSPLSAVVLWNPTTGEVVSLGQPCSRCQPVGRATNHGALAWSPDARRLAVDYTDLECGIETPPPAGNFECRGIALVSPDGVWSRISIAADGGTTLVTLVGWADPKTLIVERDGQLARLDVATGKVGRDRVETPPTTWPLSRALSPDGTKIASDPGGPTLEIVDLVSRWSTFPQGIPQDVLDFTWSPDSRWIVVQADSDGHGANRGLYLAAADGSAPARLVVSGAFGNMTWLARTP